MLLVGLQYTSCVIIHVLPDRFADHGYTYHTSLPRVRRIHTHTHTLSLSLSLYLSLSLSHTHTHTALATTLS